MTWSPTLATHFTGISVVGHGVVNAAPDRAIFLLAAVAVADTPDTAMSQASTTMQAVIQAAEQTGLPAAVRQTTTIHLTLWRMHESRPPQYRASQHLRLLVRDVDTAGSTLRRLLAAGGNHVEIEHSWLELVDRQSAVDQARELAMADARRRAEQLARLSGRPLVRSSPYVRVSTQATASGRSHGEPPSSPTRRAYRCRPVKSPYPSHSPWITPGRPDVEFVQDRLAGRFHCPTRCASER